MKSEGSFFDANSTIVTVLKGLWNNLLNCSCQELFVPNAHVKIHNKRSGIFVWNNAVLIDSLLMGYLKKTKILYVLGSIGSFILPFGSCFRK
jgi:hypothetical protein